jgi:hypothetical protein
MIVDKILDILTFDERGCAVTMVSASSAGRPLSNVMINVKKMHSIKSSPI